MLLYIPKQVSEEFWLRYWLKWRNIRKNCWWYWQWCWTLVYFFNHQTDLQFWTIHFSSFNSINLFPLSLFFQQQWATFARMWYLVNAHKQPPGRVAQQVSYLLQGKHKPIYHPLSKILPSLSGCTLFSMVGKMWNRESSFLGNLTFPGNLYFSAMRECLVLWVTVLLSFLSLC